MRALTFWKTITMDTANLLETLIDFLREQGIRFCVIGGQAVNAYVEPLVSLDVDLVVAADSLDELEKRLAERFQVRRFPRGLNISLPGSDLRVQIQTDERYQPFVGRANEAEVLGLKMPVASLEDVLQGKSGRRSTRKDVAASARRTWQILPGSSNVIRIYAAESRRKFWRDWSCKRDR